MGGREGERERERVKVSANLEKEIKREGGGRAN